MGTPEPHQPMAYSTPSWLPVCGIMSKVKAVLPVQQWLIFTPSKEGTICTMASWRYRAFCARSAGGSALRPPKRMRVPSSLGRIQQGE